MTRGALWTRHRPIALSIARDYRLPGAEPEDVDQEALLALWLATGSYDPGRGVPFQQWARIIVHRRLIDRLRMATRPRYRLLTEARREQLELLPAPDVADTVVRRDELRSLLAERETLTALERRRRTWRESKRRCRARAAA